MVVYSSPNSTAEDTHNHPKHIVDAVSRQAGLYGEQVRLLENSRRENDRFRIWKAYRAFLIQLDNDLWTIVRTAYLDAYTHTRTNTI